MRPVTRPLLSKGGVVKFVPWPRDLSPRLGLTPGPGVVAEYMPLEVLLVVPGAPPR